jgi:hypothetical protein
MVPLNSEPDEDLTTPVPREERVVEPLVPTDKNETPLVEATTKIGKVWPEEEAWTTKVPLGVVELMPSA